MIINNKQVNIWRGTDFPPTIYHVWIRKDLDIRINDGKGNELKNWKSLTELPDELANLQQFVDEIKNTIDNYTINGKYLRDNPVLDAKDIKATTTGTFYKENDNVADALMKLDKLFRTEIIGGDDG